MTDATLPANGQTADSGETRAWPRPGTVSPAGWFPPAGGEAAPSLRPGMEPARTDDTATIKPMAPEPVVTEPVAPEPAARPLALWWWALPPMTGPTETCEPATAPGAAAQAGTVPVPAGAVSEPTYPADAAPVPADAAGPAATAAAPATPDPAGRSGWQLAHQAWQESGIDWELPGQEPERTGQRYLEDPYLEDEGYLGFEPSFAALPLGAPVTADPRASRDDRAAARSTGAAGATRTPWDDRAPAFPAGAGTGSPGGTDELFRAWQGSVREAVAPRRWQALVAPWRNRAWRAAKIGVPAAVIVAVGAGALIMLTGNANDVLANRTGSGSRPGGAAATTGTAASGVPSAAAAPVALQGYPGQHGTVSVSSMWSAAGVTLAVGSADGHPAVWRHASGAAWTLESAALLGAGPGTLAAVTDGPAGWIAVGSVVAGGATEPTVLTSANGVTWQPLLAITELAGPGSQFLGVAAGHGGYVVVGKQTAGGRTFAALWWSTDLRTWSAGGNGGLDGRLMASTANAVVATADGFVAVGSHGEFAAIWTSNDGRNWYLRDLSAPPGARGATLTLVVAAGTNGSRVVAGGYAATPAGDIPVIVTSPDGGASWHEVVLGASGLVTALTATGNGFTAAGLSGAVGARRAVVWTSPDGLAWSAGTPTGAQAGNGTDEITALDSGAATAGAATAGAASTGAATTGTASTGTASTGTEVITVPDR
jgi:hypothetical protein